jgi:hypothetical protein
MAKYLTSDTLIQSVLRRAMIPQSQSTFVESDFLAFANEELDIGIVPHIQQYHEDYLMQVDYLPVTPQQSYYEIPSRATGNRLRMVNYVDPSGNVYEMTRVSIEDLPYYQNGSFGISNQGIRAFSIQNDEIVLMPVDHHSLVGYLQVSYYLSMNELVATNTVSTITAFNPYTGVVNVDMVPSNLASPVLIDILQTQSPHKRLTLDIFPSAVSQAGNTYTLGIAPIYQVTCAAKAQIPASSYFNLIANGTLTSTLFAQQSNDQIGMSTLNQVIVVWYDTTGSDPQPPANYGSIFVRVNISSAITATDVINATVSAINTAALQYWTASNVSGLLQLNTTLMGSYSSVAIENALPFSYVITNNPIAVIPDELVIGDYIAQARQCIIPNIPTELHSMLAQRVACRCLEALGDMQGLQIANQKLAEMELKTGSLLGNRVEGAPLKVVNRHGFLRQSRRMLRR